VLGISNLVRNEMEKSASTNIFFTFCHRVIYNFAQDPFFNKCQREKLECALQSVSFIGGKAGKMRKVTTQALLSGQNERLGKIHLSCGQGIKKMR
jgi:hypothetical protein